MSLQVFHYENSPITFESGDNLMVNANEMAKAFNKSPSKWLELPSTKEFISALKTIRLSDSLIKTYEGRNGGTFFHEDVALEFGRWLNPKFGIWCNERIKELFKHGITAMPEVLEKMLLNPDTMIATLTALKESREVAELKTHQLQLAETTIKAQAPKVEYYNNVLQAQNLITTNVIAADLGMSAIKLNDLLRQKKIIYKQSGIYLLYSDYRNAGYADYKTHSYSDQEGNKKTSQLLCWTEKGRQFISQILQKAS